MARSVHGHDSLHTGLNQRMYYCGIDKLIAGFSLPATSKRVLMVGMYILQPCIAGAGICDPGGQPEAAGRLRRGQGHGDHQQRARGGPSLDGAPGHRGLQEEETQRHRYFADFVD